MVSVPEPPPGKGTATIHPVPADEVDCGKGVFASITASSLSTEGVLIQVMLLESMASDPNH